MGGQAEVDAGPLRRVLGPRLLLLFIVGDVLGAGVYAVTGTVAGLVGGMAWLPFLLAFAVAGLTALSYLELVTSYPQAAGAALYTHRAFHRQALTFLVAFAVVSSGVTSAATSSGLLAGNLLRGLDSNLGAGGLDWVDIPTGPLAGTVGAVVFLVLLAVVNLRGVGESVRFNVVLTLIEMSALMIVIAIGAWVMTRNGADLAPLVDFRTGSELPAVSAISVATAVAFFAMIGFEDSVNMVEETKDPQRIFPRAMLLGLGIAVTLYMLVAVAVVTILTPAQIQAGTGSEEGVLLSAVRAGLPDLPVHRIFPFLTVFAVANTALLNMLMASRLVYGMAREEVLPRALGRVLPATRSPWAAVLFTTGLALTVLLVVRALSESAVTALAGTSGLLLLGVFTIVNVAALRLRRVEPVPGAFHAPRWTPGVAAVTCAYLAGPWARTSEDRVQYLIGGLLLAVGGVLWLLTRVFQGRSPDAFRQAPPE